MGISDRTASPFRVRTVVTLFAIVAMLLTGVSMMTSNGAKAVGNPPDVTGSSPQVGPTSGGTIVTITGTGLLETQAVYFGAFTNHVDLPTASMPRGPADVAPTVIAGAVPQ